MNIDATMARRAGSELDPSAAFERLFGDHYAKVVSIATRVLGNAAEAEDVAQEVFLSFHRLHPAGADYAGPWLYSAAAHRALNRIRTRRRRELRELADAEARSGPALDPAEIAASAETRRLVTSALARLRTRYATVLSLRYSGLSYAEIATTMHTSTGQVGTLLRRAEAQLRKEVQRVSPE